MRDSPFPLDSRLVARLARAALAEDLGSGDLSSRASLPTRLRGRATLIARQRGVVSGLPVARAVFRAVSPRVSFKALLSDGAPVRPGQALARLAGPLRALLAGERVALNFLGRLSGIATLTSRFVRAARPHGATILDTRKTTPLLRHLEKYAVRTGGGANHRFGLYDRVLLKDNHIAAVGSLARAVVRTRRALGRAPIEAEADSLAQVREALATGVDTILLDNFSPREVRRAMRLIHGRARVEISGGLSLRNIGAYARLRPDFISIGALTHSAPALDLSLDVERTARRVRPLSRRR